MRVMVIVRATTNSEAGVLPSEQLLAEMGAFNEALAKAGLLIAAEGLRPSRAGKRILRDGENRTVVEGPFAKTNELIAGYWIWEVESMEQAMVWARKCPDAMPGEAWEMELRPLVEADDFGDSFTPELREQEERARTHRIREERQELALRERMHTLQTFVAGFAHELNTPLGVIETAAAVGMRSGEKLRERGDANGKIADALLSSGKAARDAARRLSEVVKTLRRFTRLDESEIQTIDIDEVVTDAWNVVGAHVERRVKLVHESGGAAPIAGSPALMNQVFYTLLENAAESGAGTVTVRSSRENGSVRVEISDDGCGMDSATLDRIFEMKFVALGARVRCGMGLPTSASIVHHHGGRIEASSTPGVGTTFTIILPAGAPGSENLRLRCAA